MKQIDAILELARSMEPGNADLKLKFCLWTEDSGGSWVCRVDGSRYFTDAKGHSPEQAIQGLYDALIHQNQTYLSRIKKVLSKWMNRDVRIS